MLKVMAPNGSPYAASYMVAIKIFLSVTVFMLYALKICCTV